MTDIPKIKVFDGQKAVSVSFPSFKHNNCVIVHDDKGEQYRMNAQTILIMMNEYVFNVNQKKVHKWIDCPEHWNDN